MSAEFDWVMRPKVADPPIDSILSYITQEDLPIIKEIAERRSFLAIISSLDNYTGIESDINFSMWEVGAKCITQALLKGQHIHIFGDFDVDGCTATACMLFALQKLGADVTFSLADRLGKGHGIDLAQIALDAPKGSLIITVDNGVSSVNEVSELIEQGYEVLVTDHHLAEGPVVDTLVVNPKVSLDEANPEYMVPGVYVSAKLACMIAQGAPEYEEIATYCHALTALGIISDVIPLNDFIRRELTYGLIELQCLHHTGLQALFNMCGAKLGQPYTARFLSYTVLPKLNAAGRMGSPIKAVELLMDTDDKSPNQEISALRAMQLKHVNEERKLIEQNIYDECIQIVDTLELTDQPAIVLYDEKWHPGILGIIASRLVEEYGKPVLMLTKRDDLLVGSGRGVEGYDLYGALQKCENLLDGYGGHKVAAGMQLQEHNFFEFKDRFLDASADQMKDISVVLEIDAEATLKNLQDIRLQMFLENVQPTDKINNPDVILLIKNLKVLFAQEKRQAWHATVINDTGPAVTVTRFRPNEKFKIQEGEIVDLLVTPSPTYFSGITNVEWKIVDVKRRK